MNSSSASAALVLPVLSNPRAAAVPLSAVTSVLLWLSNEAWAAHSACLCESPLNKANSHRGLLLGQEMMSSSLALTEVCRSQGGCGAGRCCTGTLSAVAGPVSPLGAALGQVLFQPFLCLLFPPVLSPALFALWKGWVGPGGAGLQDEVQGRKDVQNWGHPFAVVSCSVPLSFAPGTLEHSTQTWEEQMPPR